MRLADYWEHEVLERLFDLIQEGDESFVEDRSDYVYVDGEEGDYGIVRYSDEHGQLVAVRTIHGGDFETVEFTSHGRTLIGERLIAVIRADKHNG